MGKKEYKKLRSPKSSSKSIAFFVKKLMLLFQQCSEPLGNKMDIIQVFDKNLRKQQDN
ncbi:hypothetical protein HMPREF0742_02325 [Rothia aeria F0184]|uniref:Uncharacterized protein n=1 Tax=Rothia aeria F0184 TaxID=888019 RepID=U7UYC5_9MICC|nr:hypothetical protein HMPREF0742_02325 [Rothia aeria F0184]